MCTWSIRKRLYKGYCALNPDNESPNSERNATNHGGSDCSASPKKLTNWGFVRAVLSRWFTDWLEELAYFARWNPVSLSLSRIAFVGVYTAILTSLYLKDSLHIPGISPTVPSSILTAVTFFTSSVYARAESRRTQNIREFNMFLQALMSLALTLHYHLGNEQEPQPTENRQDQATTPVPEKTDNTIGYSEQKSQTRKDEQDQAHDQPAPSVNLLIDQLICILDNHVTAGEKGRAAGCTPCSFKINCVHKKCNCHGLLEKTIGDQKNCTRTALLGAQMQLCQLRHNLAKLAKDKVGPFESPLLELEQSVRRVSGHYVPEISRVVTIFAYTSVWAWTIYLPFALIPTTHGYISVLATCFSSVFVWAITESAGGIDDIYAHEETVSDHDIQGSVQFTRQVLENIKTHKPSTVTL